MVMVVGYFPSLDTDSYCRVVLCVGSDIREEVGHELNTRKHFEATGSKEI